MEENLKQSLSEILKDPSRKEGIEGVFTPRILVKRRFSFSDIGIEILNQKWIPNPAYDAEVNTAWRKKEQKVTAWDGTHYRVTNVSELEGNSGPLLLRLGTIPYRYIGTLSELKKHYKESGSGPLNHLSTAAIIRTTDGYYLFGKRSGNGSIDLIGGGVQQDELEVVSGVDLERNMYKEMEEESGIQKQDVQEMTGVGILFSFTSNILIIAHAQLTLTKQEAEKVFVHKKDDEMEDLVFIPEAELAAFLRRMSSYRLLIPDLLG